MPKNVKIVIERLEAWADGAEYHLRNCAVEWEDYWRNQRDNYRELVRLLKEDYND